jgi:hypothetical protein
MQRIKRVLVVVAGAGLLVIGALVGGPDPNDSYNDPRGDFVTASGDPGSAAIYRNTANSGQRVGAIGLSGDGIDQDDLVARGRPIRSNGDGSDHSWSVASITTQPGGDLFGVRFS